MKLISHQALAQYMTHRGYTVRGLAIRTGINRSTIGHLRSGHRKNIDSDDANKIAKALDFPVDALFVSSVSHVSRNGGRAA